MGKYLVSIGLLIILANLSNAIFGGHMESNGSVGFGLLSMLLVILGSVMHYVDMGKIK